MTAIQPEGSPFSRFMASSSGRLARVALGIALLITGLLVGGGWGLAIGIFSAVPIAAGVFNLCPIAPAWGGHFLGSRYCAAPKRPAK